MSQLQKPIAKSRSVSPLRPDRLVAATLVAAAIAVSFVSGTLIGSSLKSPATDAAARAVSGEVTDSWMVPGYLPTIRSSAAGEVTDSWMVPGYLPTQDGD